MAELHYSVSWRSFLLQLSILELELSAYAPSHVAAAALCEAFVAFGKEAWPEPIVGYAGYTLEQLTPVRPAPARRRVACPALHGPVYYCGLKLMAVQLVGGKRTFV